MNFSRKYAILNITKIREAPMKRIFCLILLLLCVMTACSTPSTDTYEMNHQENSSKPSGNVNKITVTNPLIWDDIPDVDIIRVGNEYYMVSTTMFYNPGVPIMRSTDLAHWELVGYVYDIVEESPQTDLFGENHSYSKGSWAASIRYYDGEFYVTFACLDLGKSFIYKTDDVTSKNWTEYEFNRVFHDPSLFFEDDGTPYIIHGGGNEYITELVDDCSAVKPGGIDQVLFNSGLAEGLSGAEGAHFYKINGKYYCTMISYATNTPGINRAQLTFRSDSLLEGWEGKVVLCDNMGHYNNGTAQGGIVDTPEGDWYAMVFQDHGAVGRIPILQPVEWIDGWPIPGEDGKAAKEVTVLSDREEYEGSTFMRDDEFDSEEMSLYWQFNHNPKDRYWDLVDGCYRITTSRVDRDIFHALNTLTHRTEGPTCTHEVLLHTDGLGAGDDAGIAACMSKTGMIGARVDENGKKDAYFATQRRPNNDFEIIREEELTQNDIYLRIEYRFTSFDEEGNMVLEDQARFYYSLDGEKWEKLGKGFTMEYDLDLFTGARTALYCYSTVKEGGHADFEYFHVVK